MSNVLVAAILDPPKTIANGSLAQVPVIRSDIIRYKIPQETP
jgi:hypothetical protein